MKRIFLISLVFMISFISSSAKIIQVVIDGIQYSFNNSFSGSSGDAEVISYSYAGDITIPGSFKYDGKSYIVSSIGISAFENCKNLNSVTIPSNVRHIKYNAFAGCTNLNSITLNTYSNNLGAAGVVSIGSSAFKGCTSLLSITLPKTLTTIESGAFSNSGLISVTIPEKVSKIADNTFARCSNLTNIFLPNTITNIGSGAFDGCENLSSIVVS